MDGEIMKNTYLFRYLPIISILLFSLSFAIYGEMQCSSYLEIRESTKGCWNSFD